MDAISELETDTHSLLGVVCGVWPAGTTDQDPAAPDSSARARSEADVLLAEMGWSVTEHNPARHVIDQTLKTLRSLGVNYDWRSLLPYARLSEKIAAVDLDQLGEPLEPLEKAERAVVLTFLLEPVLLALRRLAQEADSKIRYGS